MSIGFRAGLDLAQWALAPWVVVSWAWGPVAGAPRLNWIDASHGTHGRHVSDVV